MLEAFEVFGNGTELAGLHYGEDHEIVEAGHPCSCVYVVLQDGGRLRDRNLLEDSFQICCLSCREISGGKDEF